MVSMTVSAQCCVDPNTWQATLVICPWNIQLLDLMLGETFRRRSGSYSEWEKLKAMVLFLWKGGGVFREQAPWNRQSNEYLSEDYDTVAYSYTHMGCLCNRASIHTNGTIYLWRNSQLNCFLEFVISNYVELLSGILFCQKYDLSTNNAALSIMLFLSMSPPKWGSTFAATHFENEAFWQTNLFYLNI